MWQQRAYEASLRVGLQASMFVNLRQAAAEMLSIATAPAPKAPLPYGPPEPHSPCRGSVCVWGAASSVPLLLS